MRVESFRWDVDVTALSSVAHSDEVLGAVRYLRRERFLTPAGTQDVPVVSGNSVRGVLRDHGASLLWDALGQPQLPLPVMHALWSGGALVKAKTSPLSGQKLADLRTMVAHVGVFGVAGGGRIVDGALTVGKWLPVCAQVEHVLPDRWRDRDGGAGLPDVYDLLQIEWYSRDPGHLPVVAATDGVSDLTGASDSDDGEFSGGSEGGVLMRYGVETFIAGTMFTGMFALNHVTGPEYQYFNELLDTWLTTATVGGQSGRGLGRVRLDFQPNHQTPAIDSVLDGMEHGWRAFAGHETGDVIRALSWLD